MKTTSLWQQANAFQRTALVTLAITFFLIFVGGLVRAAGAGLGCPDWPRCFGLWIPPVSADGLPASFDPAQFNVFKTWLEYINRLIGVAVGIGILLTAGRSLRYWRTDRSITLSALAAVVLVIFQGWLGGQVVRSALAGWMITIHMLIAVLILNTLLFTVFRSLRAQLTISLTRCHRARLNGWLIGLISVTLLQVVFGTQVREALSELSAAHPQWSRMEWVENIGLMDAIHRSFSWLVLGASIGTYWIARRVAASTPLQQALALNNSAVVVQILMGVGLVYAGLPPALQLMHLVVAAFMTASQWAAWLIVWHATTAQEA
jgi:heme a synthase